MHKTALITMATSLAPHERETRDIHLVISFSLAFALAPGLSPAGLRTAAALAAAVLLASVLFGFSTLLLGAECLASCSGHLPRPGCLRSD